ncbi:MAG TPA: TonB-dependent receptor, partial [Candidatus Kapabacteria bacterium]|nr:TonB-dependent receptor [Candidatus Kapabacteria bacterium]
MIRSRAAVAGWRGVVVSGLICVGVQSAQAEDVAVTQAATPELEAVVVTASRTATGLGETPAAISRLENDAITDSKPRLISDVIDRVPGVHMVDLGNEQHSMSIRQPITTSALYQYLEDNIPIRPLGVFNHNALNEINLAGVDSVEVMRGPTSSLYGSNAVGGAVNFLSAAPSLTPEAWAGLRGSDQGYGRVDVGASGTEGDLGARLSYYRSVVNDGWREYGDGDKDSLSARVDYVLSDSSLVKTVGSYTNLYTDMSGSLGESDYQNNPEKSYQTFTERTDINSRISSSLETEWDADTSTRATLFWRDNSHGQIPSYQLGSCQPTPPAETCTTNGRQNDNSYTSYGFDSQFNRALGFMDARMILGAGWDRTKNDYSEDNLSVLRDTELRYVSYTVTSKRRRYDALIDNPSVYFQGEIKPLDLTTVVLGGRYDKIRYDFDNHLAPSSSTGAPDEIREFSHVSPRLGIARELGQDAELFLNLSQGFVPPEV